MRTRLGKRTAGGILLALGAWVLLGLTCAGTPRHVLSASDVARTRMVGEAKISPDGGTVAYVLRVPRDPATDDDGKHWSELHVARSASDSRPYVTGAVNLHHIRFLPDGSGIAFLSKRGDDEHTSVWAIPIDGGEARQVISHDSAISTFDFSSDGSRIAFVARPEEDGDLEALRKRGFDAKVFEEQHVMNRVWIADFEGDASSQSQDTPMALRDSWELKTDPRMLSLSGSASRIQWDPAGKRLAVTAAPTPLVDDSYMQRDVYIVDPGVGSVLRHLDLPGKLGATAFSPDGAHLAVVAGEDIHDPKAGSLFLWNLATDDWRPMLPEFPGHVQAVAWKNSQVLTFVAHQGVWSSFNAIGLAAGAKPESLIGDANSGPILRDLSVSADGSKAAFIADSPEHPREVFVGDVSVGGGAVAQRWTSSNSWLQSIPLAKQEVVRFAARDDVEIEGLLIRPLGEQSGRRYPMIMSVHGGPESHNSNGWLTSYSYPGQLAAGRGFAVFYPNYRGSTGRGVAFSKMGQADYAGAEFDDLVDAVEHLVKSGLVDRARVGITGGSYGGYASAWGATKLTEHFAASVMFVGISDQVSKVGTSDIPTEMFNVHGRRWPWEHWDWFRERSPLFYVEQARTPILILHGEEDTRVHPSQSMQLYRYLKILDKTPVRLVLYPKEGHGNRRMASRLDYSLRMMRWMEHYLQGRGGQAPSNDLTKLLAAEGVSVE